MANTTSPLSDILFYLTVCGKCWLVIYLSLLLVNSTLTSLTLHVMAIGLLICILAALKLPSPDKDLVKNVLGDDMDIQDQENAGENIRILFLLLRFDIYLIHRSNKSGSE